MKTKDIYIVYCGEDIPYEPSHAHCAFEDYDEAKKFCEKCNEQEEEKNKKYNEAVSILNEWDTWLEQHDMTPTWDLDELDNTTIEAISKEFKVTQEYIKTIYKDTLDDMTTFKFRVSIRPYTLYLK